MNGWDKVLSKPIGRGRVLIGHGGELRRHEKMPGDLEHGVAQPAIERVGADLVAGQVEMDVDHLHHMAAEDGEMLLGHWLHESHFGQRRRIRKGQGT